MRCTAELRQILLDLVEPDGRPADMQRLAEILRNDADARRYYLRFMDVHGRLELLAESPLALPGDASARETTLAQVAPRPSWRSAMRSALRKRRALVASVSAAMLLNALTVLVMSWMLIPTDAPSRVARPTENVVRLVRTVDAHFEGFAPLAGAKLNAGVVLELKSGWAEFEFLDGTRVVVEGPSTFLPRAANAAELSQGKLTARSRQGVTGFTVHTPKASVVDLGTEFGVHVEAGGAVETTVFSGRIHVHPVDDNPSANSEPKAGDGQIVLRGQTVRVAVGQPQFAMPVGQPTIVFARSLPQRMPQPLEVWGTGIGKELGERDDHWQIVACSRDPQFTPRAAIVTPSIQMYMHATAAGNWVSVARDSSVALDNANYSFRTTFSLAGRDPTTARLAGSFAADNSVSAIRINGRDVGVKPENVDQYAWRRPFVIASGFQPGENTLEFVVENNFNSGKPNPLALLVEVRGTAEPTIVSPTNTSLP